MQRFFFFFFLSYGVSFDIVSSSVTAGLCRVFRWGRGEVDTPTPLCERHFRASLRMGILHGPVHKPLSISVCHVRMRKLALRTYQVPFRLRTYYMIPHFGLELHHCTHVSGAKQLEIRVRVLQTCLESTLETFLAIPALGGKVRVISFFFKVHVSGTDYFELEWIFFLQWLQEGVKV